MARVDARPRSRAIRAPKISLDVKYLGEPDLQFCAGRLGVSQQTGIARFGPHSLDLARHPTQVRLGFVGSGKSIGLAREWYESCARGVVGNKTHADFPGFQADRGFFVDLITDDSLVETMTTFELEEVKEPRLKRHRFERIVELFSEKVRLLSQRDQPPDYIVLAIPDEIIDYKVVEYVDPELGAVHRDLRRALKAELMRHRIPTQIVLERVMGAADNARNVDHRSKCAWNLFTSLYFKAGGVPWAPTSLRPGTCYVGVSFYRPLGDKSGRVRTSVAQAFDEHGEGIVLRGQDFAWDEKQYGKSPHLDHDGAAALIEMVLRRYEAEMKQKPARIVLHKTSRFWEEEREGFMTAIKGVRELDLLAVNPISSTRLLRAGQYPPLRSTRFRIGDLRFLYTTGYVPGLGYPHGHVPSPLRIADHIGDTDLDDLLREILVLSKMNWNSAGFAGLMPITVRFSRLVGDVMREIPLDREPEPQFKYYI